MGYEGGNKDRLWKEAPGYCVECGLLKPLNSSSVCEECYDETHLTDYESWEEDDGKSQEYYQSGQIQKQTDCLMSEDLY